MSFNKVLDIASSAMAANAKRIELSSNNLANANSVSSTEAGAYRAQLPVFSTVLNTIETENGRIPEGGVQVSDIVQSKAPVLKKYQPEHPKANSEGYVFQSNVNSVEEMVNVMSASQDYRSSVEVMNTTKLLIQQAIRSLE